MFPEAFEQRMRRLLGEEYDAFAEKYTKSEDGKKVFAFDIATVDLKSLPIKKDSLVYDFFVLAKELKLLDNKQQDNARSPQVAGIIDQLFNFTTMAEIALKGNMKVKTLKAEFKKAFGSTLRVYKSASCKGAFADDDATLASIRAEGAKGGELAVKGNMQVGNFEKKVAEMYGIGVQVANADDSALADNSATLVGAGK